MRTDPAVDQEARVVNLACPPEALSAVPAAETPGPSPGLPNVLSAQESACASAEVTPSERKEMQVVPVAVATQPAGQCQFDLQFASP